MADAGLGKMEDNPKILSGPVLTNSPNAVLSKTLLNRYNDLPMPADKILATYIWIDGSGENLRCKDRTLNFIPKEPKAKVTRIIEDVNVDFVWRISKKLKLDHMKEYLPPYFIQRDLDKIFPVHCKLRDRQNSHKFDENLKGFAVIVSSLRNVPVEIITLRHLVACSVVSLAHFHVI